MSKSKSYNRIVFLTTLSLYLGLVLVGGTAPVLAHSATTKSFDVHNEIELKDDLDKKPDDDLIAQSIIGIVNDLDSFSRSKRFNWETKSSLTVEELNFCESDSSPAYGGTWSPTLSDNLLEVVQTHLVKIGRNFDKIRSDSGLGRFQDGYPEGISFNFLTENKSLNLQIKTYIKNDVAARKFFDSINSHFSQDKARLKNSKLNFIYENTTISSKNNQVFIVTRLPRAAIDEFLAR